MTKQNLLKNKVHKLCRTMYITLRRSGKTRQGALESMKDKAHAISKSHTDLVHNWINNQLI